MRHFRHRILTSGQSLQRLAPLFMLLLVLFWTGACFGQTLTITDNGSTSISLPAGVASANQVLQTFKVVNGTATAGTLTGVTIPTFTYTNAADITDVKLYYGLLNTANGSAGGFTSNANTTLAATVTTLPSTGAALSFGTLSVPIAASGTFYVWIVTDITSSGSNNDVITASALGSSNFTLSAGSITSAVANTATQKIVTASNFYWNGGNTSAIALGLTTNVPSSPTWAAGNWGLNSLGTFTAGSGSTLTAGSSTVYGNTNLSNSNGGTIVLGTGAATNTGGVIVGSTGYTLTSTSGTVAATLAAPILLNNTLTVSPYNPSGQVNATYAGIVLNGPITGSSGLTISTTTPAGGSAGQLTQGANVNIANACTYTGATTIGSGTSAGTSDVAGSNAQIMYTGSGAITNSPITVNFGSQLFFNGNPITVGSSASPLPAMNVCGAGSTQNSGGLRVKSLVTYYGNIGVGYSTSSANNTTFSITTTPVTVWTVTNNVPSAIPTVNPGLNLYGALVDYYPAGTSSANGGAILSKQGGGTLALYPNATNDANTISGGYNIGNGTVQLAAGQTSLVGTNNGIYGPVSINETSNNTPLLSLSESAAIGNLSSAFSDNGAKTGGEYQGVNIVTGKTLTINQTNNYEFGSNGYYGPLTSGSYTSGHQSGFTATNGTVKGQSSYLFGGGNIIKQGTAALALTSTNDLYTGTITVNNGTLAIDNGGSAITTAYNNTTTSTNSNPTPPSAIIPGSIAGNVVVGGGTSTAVLAGMGGIGIKPLPIIMQLLQAIFLQMVLLILILLLVV